MAETSEPASGGGEAVRLEHVTKRYGDVSAVDGLDLEVRERGVLLDARSIRLGEDHLPAARSRDSRPPPRDGCFSPGGMLARSRHSTGM